MKDKILIVDDDPLILKGYRRSLRNRFTLDTAGSGREALELIADGSPYAVVVSDMRMPGMDGLELLQQLHEASPDTVRVMLTGNADQQTAVDAVNKGKVFRFLTKPCDSSEMADVLQKSVERFQMQLIMKNQGERDAERIQLLTRKLSYQSRHDILTGLANRSTFELRMESALSASYREGREHALCYLDLDHFHVINDTCGNIAGDELLREVSLILSTQRRRGDLVARLSGDHFGILLSDCPLSEAQRIIETLHDKIRLFRFQWEERQFSPSVSIGLVPVTNNSEDVASLFGAAETACNVAKDQGRNQLHVSNKNDQELTSRLGEMQWVSRINAALEEDRFHLYYQTITPIGNNRESGEHYELLVRLEDEEGNIVPPGEFLSAAENFHLSSRLDRWVISTAVNWYLNHPQSLARLTLCSINLSGHSLGKPEMLKFIIDQFNRTGLPAEKFCFEVTETAAVSQLSSTVEFIRILKQAGFYFSLDDFGTGVSSFAYLKNLPVDYLKIDGTFVKQIDQNSIDRAMVKSINEIGKTMGKKTIAEFVENEAIKQELITLGVDFIQGYLIGKPKPLDELALIT
ncbi:MAG: EAL domain-containing protein [gamma proteobacterium endosymbiont of Lamellibrachia anaximandri]|nr:EAL domain-containing protein [gamma proteobacterium endosymbiont of Lamellibrachia anaximandri]MBL3533952.1 EAL domain-containing protein [gamma proteobacterium endosymbiont of Lamellibrachia anaximandri]